MTIGWTIFCIFCCLLSFLLGYSIGKDPIIDDISSGEVSALPTRKILNRPLEGIMNQAFEETKFYCVQCTARKFEGWAFCPFCGNSKYYHTSLHGIRVESLGVVRPTKQTVNQCPPEAASMSLPPQDKVEHLCRLNPDVRIYLRRERRIFLCFGIGLGTLMCIVIRFLST